MDSIKISQKLEGIIEKTLLDLVELKVEVMSLGCEELDGVSTLLDSAISEKCKGNIGRCFKMVWNNNPANSNPDTCIVVMTICNDPGDHTTLYYRGFARNFVPTSKGLLAGKIYKPYTQDSRMKIDGKNVKWSNNLASPDRVTEIMRDGFFDIMSSARRMERGILDPTAGVLIAGE